MLQVRREILAGDDRVIEHALRDLAALAQERVFEDGEALLEGRVDFAGRGGNARRRVGAVARDSGGEAFDGAGSVKSTVGTASSRVSSLTIARSLARGK